MFSCCFQRLPLILNILKCATQRKVYKTHNTQFYDLSNYGMSCNCHASQKYRLELECPFVTTHFQFPPSFSLCLGKNIGALLPFLFSCFPQCRNHSPSQLVLNLQHSSCLNLTRPNEPQDSTILSSITCPLLKSYNMYDFLKFLSFNIAFADLPILWHFAINYFLTVYHFFTQLLQLIIHSIADECLKCVHILSSTNNSSVNTFIHTF